MKYLSEATIKYMNDIWHFEGCDPVDELMMFWDNSEYEMVAKRLVDSGAVEANCLEAKEMIKVAKSIKNHEMIEIVSNCLKGRTILECKNCGHIHYIPSWCDPKDWVNDCESCGK
jgi:hypothetical protein